MTDTGSLVQAAAQANAEGRLDEAEALARRALAIQPDDSDALLALGIAGVKKNDPSIAVAPLERLIALEDRNPKTEKPHSADAAFWLAMLYRQQRQHALALPLAECAAAGNPASEHSQNLLGMCLLDVGRPAEAVEPFQQACELAPKVGPLFENLGRACRAAGRNEEAIAAYRRAMELGPVRPGILLQLGDAYMAIPDPAGAAGCARAMLAMDRVSAPGTLLMARALIADGQVAEGAKFAEQAVDLAPSSAAPAAYFGRALQSLGEMDEANRWFTRSIELDAKQGFAYYSLVQNRKIKVEDRPLVSQMADLAKDESITPRERIQLEYGLGKALEDLGEYEESMRHYDRANQVDHELKLTSVPPFDPAALLQTADFLIDSFGPLPQVENRKSKIENPQPIFVVGMMRSGTTLAEQILSSHPDVGGAGEVLFWPENAGAGADITSKFTQLLECAPGTLNPEPRIRLRQLAQQYLALLARLAPSKPFVVDKMNTNYLHVGLLHLLYPDARFVHMKRHPVDTCISIWATPVANGIDLCASKENVVFAYEEYLRVMDHWRRVIPPDRLIDVQYEELVGDREPVTRQVLEFCGLEWDDACMSPEKNKRSVKTPSVWQVRQPVYKTSVERWRKFEPWLGAFAKLLRAG